MQKQSLATIKEAGNFTAYEKLIKKFTTVQEKFEVIEEVLYRQSIDSANLLTSDNLLLITSDFNHNRRLIQQLLMFQHILQECGLLDFTDPNAYLNMHISKLDTMIAGKNSITTELLENYIKPNTETSNWAEFLQQNILILVLFIYCQIKEVHRLDIL